MAVYRWIYSSARIKGDQQDFLVRLCDPPLKKYKETLLLVSQRLLSTERRYGKAEEQTCWFSGYIEEEQKMYVIAVGTKQDSLLEMSLQGGEFRTQFCVLGYGLTGGDIQIYQKEEVIFEPLKEILRKIQTTGEELAFESKGDEIPQFSIDKKFLQEKETIAQSKEIYNIQKSTPEFDNIVWKQSKQRQVMTGILSVEDAKRLLDLFSAGIVTVVQDVQLQYSAKKNISSSLMEELNKEKAQALRQKEKMEELKREVEEGRKAWKVKEEKIRQQEEKKRSRRKWIIILWIVGLGLLGALGLKEWLDRQNEIAASLDVLKVKEENLGWMKSEEQI